MKILFVVFGTEKVAATRFRVCQYLPYFKKNNIEYRVFSILSVFMTGQTVRSPEFGTIRRMVYYLMLNIDRLARFLYVSAIAGKYDMIFFQRVTAPLGLGWLLNPGKQKIIFDIDDAIYLPDTDKKDLLSKLKYFIRQKEADGIMSASDCVIVENDYIKSYAEKFCKRIRKIPGPIDTTRYFVKHKENDDYDKYNIIIGWIGSPATTGYLRLLDNVFKAICKKYKNVAIVLIGAGKYDAPVSSVISKVWDYNTEVRELQKFDIGIMPMPDDRWTNGKLGCKMLQYMAVGIPSVVSYTKTNAELIADGRNGFLVRTEQEWIDRLSLLIENDEVRYRLGRVGRDVVEKVCSVRVNAPKMLEIFKKLSEENKI